ncbi:MAG: nitroreductase [Ignavibacteriae bacterium]|nr:MAG: nitroreductase [Ignavibacteriota bacterium]
MNKPIEDIIRQRISCRTYLEKPIEEHHRRLLHDFLESIHIGPLGTHARFTLVAATEGDQESLKRLGTYGFIKNPAGFIVGAVEEGPKNLEDYGYLLERAVLYATGLGLGTCWLGGTFTKSRFAKTISAAGTEKVPAVISTGYGASEDNIRGQLRRQAGAPRRYPAEQLFFDKSFGSVLQGPIEEKYSQILELVRRAPSASNKQPWRIIRNGDAWHFYLQRTAGYGKGSLKFILLRLADLQRVDMGIAMCHFELAAREFGLQGSWVVDEPKIDLPDDTEYTVSWMSM